MNRCRQTRDGLECPYEGKYYLIPSGNAYNFAFSDENKVPYTEIETQKYYYLKDIRFSFVKLVKIIEKAKDTITLHSVFSKNTDVQGVWIQSYFPEDEKEDISEFQDSTLQFYRVIDRTPRLMGGRHHRKTKRSRRSRRRTYRR
jgi:hypothetical protein